MCVAGGLVSAQESPSGVGATRSAVHTGGGQEVSTGCQLVIDQGDAEPTGSEGPQWNWVAYTGCLANLVVNVCSRDGTSAVASARGRCC